MGQGVIAGNNQNLNGLGSNRPSIVMTMPLTLQNTDIMAARPTPANGLHSSSIVNLIRVNEQQYKYQPSSSSRTLPERSFSQPKDKVGVIAPQSFYKPTERPLYQTTSSYNINQSYKINQEVPRISSNPHRED